MKRNYRISTHTGIETVQGYPVIIPGFEIFSFFAHRTPDFEGWQISEESTGMGIMPSSFPGGESIKTRKGAVAVLTNIMHTVGIYHAKYSIARAPKIS